MSMSASHKDPKKMTAKEFEKPEKPEPMSNRTQEKMILLKLRITNPEAYKLLKGHGFI